MAELSDQLSQRIQTLAVQHRRVAETQQAARLAKEDLARKRKVAEEEQEKLNRIVGEIADIENGQAYLPFDEHPDTSDTPALKAVSKAMAETSISKPKSLDVNLSILIGYGVTEASIAAIMDGDTSVKTVSDLCDRIRSDNQWHKAFKGLGGKKKSIIEEAVQKMLDDGAKPKCRDEEPDNRLRKCLNAKCGEFRQQSMERCPTCGDSTFVLENPPADAEGDSIFDPDYVASRKIETGPGSADLDYVLIHTVQHHETGLWHSSFSAYFDGKLVAGREIPLHTSEAHGSENEAILSACVLASGILIEMELDGASAAVREFMDRIPAADADPVAY